MRRPIVYVARGEDPYEVTKAVLNRYPVPDLSSKRVLIKPNAARLASPGQGVTTHPAVVAATIDFLRDRGVKEVIIGESCIFGVRSKEAFSATGFLDLARQKGVKVLDLDQLFHFEIPIPQGIALDRIRVSGVLKLVDFIISVPVMKTHMHTGVSLSLKNMKGLLWRREKARLHHIPPNKSIEGKHKALDIAISEMATVLRPDFAIIDGTVGMEGMGPAYGRPKPMGLVVISSDPLAADAVACRLMGFRPSQIPHLKLAFRKGLGEMRLSKISVRPRDYINFVSPFEPPPRAFSLIYPDLVVHDKGSCSACLSSLMLFLRNYSDCLGSYKLADSKVHLGVGKHLQHVPEGTILVGNCTSRLKLKGIFIGGCPPVPSQMRQILLRNREREGRSV